MNRRVSRNSVIAEARQLRAIFHAKRLLASTRLNVRQNTESSRRVLRTKTLATIPDIILAKSSTISLSRSHDFTLFLASANRQKLITTNKLPYNSVTSLSVNVDSTLYLVVVDYILWCYSRAVFSITQYNFFNFRAIVNVLSYSFF